MKNATQNYKLFDIFKDFIKFKIFVSHYGIQIFENICLSPSENSSAFIPFLLIKSFMLLLLGFLISKAITPFEICITKVNKTFKEKKLIEQRPFL
jgi:hypothetical protein